ncbi:MULTISPECIES: hypothetical protein [unclassified Nocardia]|uniref:hypothetical protein n=1 Tax=unclassified Nocardia TaxID=2637762 RepID=UPI001CE3ED8A|nr:MULTISPECIES: hypothetical protein [unclassified Nocardia]
MRDKAIGFLQQEISGEDQGRDEQLIRDTAALIGYGLVEIVAVNEDTFMPTVVVIQHLQQEEASAIIAPSADHVWRAGRAYTEFCDVIAADTGQVWARGHRWPPLTHRPGIPGA